ncbi:hypothetical protein M9458_038942, partial [Cirrhinus mrigala]
AKRSPTFCRVSRYRPPNFITVRRELHGMGFHGQAAAFKPYITKCNAKRQM